MSALAISCPLRLAAFGRFLPFVTGSNRPRLCKNAGLVLKSASLRKIRQRLVMQQTWNLRRRAIFVPNLLLKPALKRFYTASAIRGHSFRAFIGHSECWAMRRLPAKKQPGGRSAQHWLDPRLPGGDRAQSPRLAPYGVTSTYRYPRSKCVIVNSDVALIKKRSMLLYANTDGISPFCAQRIWSW